MGGNMSGMRGGDLEQLQTLENAFRTQKGAVETLKTRISTALTNTAWQGPQAERFRADWTNEFSAGLRKLQEALESNANFVKTARTNIQEMTR